MYFIGQALIFTGGMIETDSMILPFVLIMTGTVICLIKYLADRKRTCKSGNFRKFNI